MPLAGRLGAHAQTVLLPLVVGTEGHEGYCRLAGRSWPHSVNDVLVYLECLASGGKSAGVLLQVLEAVRFMEAAGEVRRGLHRLLHSPGQLPARARDFGD